MQAKSVKPTEIAELTYFSFFELKEIPIASKQDLSKLEIRLQEKGFKRCCYKTGSNFHGHSQLVNSKVFD